MHTGGNNVPTIVVLHVGELVDDNIEELIPPTVLGKGPMISIPQTTEDHEGGIICSA
jgi:hypothetical protein